MVLVEVSSPVTLSTGWKLIIGLCELTELQHGSPQLDDETGVMNDGLTLNDCGNCKHAGANMPLQSAVYYSYVVCYEEKKNQIARCLNKL